MVLNNKGSVMFYMLMLGVVLIVMALALAPVIKQNNDNVMGANTDTNQGLDCSNSSISDFQKAQCYLVDASAPFFFFGLLSLAGIVIGAKYLITGEI